MLGTHSRIGTIVVSCAFVGFCLALLNLGERPRFDRVAFEAMLFAPLVVWLLGRRSRLRR